MNQTTDGRVVRDRSENSWYTRSPEIESPVWTRTRRVTREGDPINVRTSLQAVVLLVIVRLFGFTLDRRHV